MPDETAVHIGRRLRAERKAREYTVADLAERIRDTAPERDRRGLPKLRDIERTIRGHEAGAHTVGPRYRLRYARALGITEDELFGQPLLSTPRGTNNKETPLLNDWDEMERRVLLRLAAVGVGTGALASPGEAARWFVNSALTGPPRDLDGWALACADHLHAIRTRPAKDVHDEVLLDLLALRRRIQEPGDEDVRELYRMLATLSSLQANILTRLGDFGPALRWWRGARDAADASGDLQLGLMIRSTEAGFSLYGLRSPDAALRLAREVRRRMGDRPSHLRTLIIGTEVKALSLLGRHEEALRGLETLGNDVPENGPSTYPAYWNGCQADFAASWVHAGAGREAAADAARGRVLASAKSDYQYGANVQLHEALCTVTKGGVERGARQAVEVIDGLAPAYRSRMILETGKNVLRAVPPAQRRRAPVRDLQVLLAAG
ncbi:helix-turn-helix transcriptional regulator [Spirillospora sp. NPDC029432]|uniref:helix-turn-helix domain-containing protein n=1 Tax=Spirillospora sp. NPDC029432 TaxID=3154599 RepID=UPI003451252E